MRQSGSKACKFLLFLTIIIMVSCSDGDSPEARTFPTVIKETEFSLDDIATDLSFIPLNFGQPVAQIKEIKWKDPYLYVATTNGSVKGLLSVFDIQGNLIKSFDRVGRGPGEYLSIMDFEIDDNGAIYINSWHKIVVYDKAFKHIRDIRWPDDLNFAEMHLHNNKIYLFSENLKVLPEYDWFVLDTLGNIISAKPYNCYHKVHYPPPFPLIVFHSDDKLFRYRSISDTIFAIKGAEYVPAYTVDRNFSDGYRLHTKEEVSSDLRWDRLMNTLRNEKLRNPELIYDIGRMWILQYRTKFRKKANFETVLFDKEVNTLALINRFEVNRNTPVYWGIPNDWLGFGPMKPDYVIQIDSDYYILSIWEITRLKELVGSEVFINSTPKRPKLKNKLQLMADSLDYESDPVLFLLKLKK